MTFWSCRKMARQEFFYLFIHLFIYLLTLSNVKKPQKTIVISTNLQVLIYIDKKIIIIIIIIDNRNKVNWLCVFYLYESQSSDVYFTYSTQAFGVFPQLNNLLEAHKGATFLYFRRELLPNYGLLYAIVSSPQYTVFGNRLSRSLRFLIVYGMFLNLNISFIIGGDKPFRHLKVSKVSFKIYDITEWAKNNYSISGSEENQIMKFG